MAEGDIFGAVTPNNKASQREALRALAQGGTSAKQAYEAGLQAQQADKSKLYGDILDRATAINAPAGTTEQLAGPAMRGSDARTQALTGASSSSQAALQAINAANSNYFDQVTAALPIVKARSEQVLAERKAREAKEAEEAMTPQKIIAALGGVGVFRDLLGTAPSYEVGEYVSDTDPMTGEPRDNPFVNKIRMRESNKQESAGEMASQLGLPRSYGQLVEEEEEGPAPGKAVLQRTTSEAAKLMGKDDKWLRSVTGRTRGYTKAAQEQLELEEGAKGNVFEDASQTYVGLIKQGIDPDTAAQRTVNQLKKAYGQAYPETVQLVRALYG